MRVKRLTRLKKLTRVSRLSRLQKWVLTAAVNPRENGRLYVAEIKSGYYKFPVPEWMTRNYGGDLSAWLTTYGHVGSQFFKPGECVNYRAATVAISRAITRLERRGRVNV